MTLLEFARQQIGGSRCYMGHGSRQWAIIIGAQDGPYTCACHRDRAVARALIRSGVATSLEDVPGLRPLRAGHLVVGLSAVGRVRLARLIVRWKDATENEHSRPPTLAPPRGCPGPGETIPIYPDQAESLHALISEAASIELSSPAVERLAYLVRRAHAVGKREGAST